MSTFGTPSGDQFWTVDWDLNENGQKWDIWYPSEIRLIQ